MHYSGLVNILTFWPSLLSVNYWLVIVVMLVQCKNYFELINFNANFTMLLCMITLLLVHL